MAGFGDTFEADVLKLIFQAVTIEDLAENDTTSPLTNLYVALHTADPTETGDQTSSECAYTSYARVAVARTSGGWSITGSTISNVGAINFPQCTGGSETATHVSVGWAASGASKIIAFGALDSGLAISSGITPSFAAGALDITLD